MAALPPWLTLRDGGVVVAVKAVPRASRTRAVGEHGDLLRVQIAAPPHEGQSNAALCAYLASLAGVRATQVRVMRGSAAARKLIAVDGDPHAVARSLVAAVAEAVPR
ncbi:MAG: DUF167 domain-containing protein [Actinomycetota bacterium]